MTAAPEIPADVMAAAREVAGRWNASPRNTNITESIAKAIHGERIRSTEAIRKVRDGYAQQARFADADCAVHFREFVRRIDAIQGPTT